MGHSPQENSVMRSSPTPAENSSSCLKSETYIEHLLEFLNINSKGVLFFPFLVVSEITHRLHGSTCDNHRSALLQHLGKVDRWIQQQELDTALRQSAWTEKDNNMVFF